MKLAPIDPAGPLAMSAIINRNIPARARESGGAEIAANLPPTQDRTRCKFLHSRFNLRSPMKGEAP